ncbi:MAG: CoA transferase [Actinomycetia bacterium]|nr:CoA transferase [Actinomycetes bacterium]
MRPLEDIVVLDLGQIYNAPYASLLLAYAGAEIIKIEPPEGEALRRQTPPGEPPHPFLLLNGNKKSVALDLKHPQGRALFLDLVRQADVVVENFAVGTMDRLGLGVDVLRQVNPRVVVATGKGFGTSGPHAHYPAMDLTVQALTGIMASTGFPDQPPVKAGVAFVDFLAGVHLAYGILLALFQRERTGTGQVVEVAMQDAVIPTLASNLGGYLASGGTLPERTGNRHGGLAIAPYNTYACRDGWVAVLAVTDRHWQAVARVIGRPELADHPDWRTMGDRARRMEEVDALVEAWTRPRSREEVVRILTAEHVPAAPVASLGEVLADPHVAARGMLAHVPHPVFGDVMAFGNPVRLSAADPVPPAAAPVVGRDTAAVLRARLGLSDAALAQLAAEGVIRTG